MAVTSDPAEPIIIKANLSGTIKGRVVSASGDPRPNVRISGAGVTSTSATGLAAAIKLPIAQLFLGEYQTDDEGKFEIKGLVAGWHYKLSGQARDPFTSDWGNIATDGVLSPGQTLDLGDVQMIKPSRGP